MIFIQSIPSPNLALTSEYVAISDAPVSKPESSKRSKPTIDWKWKQL